MISLKDGVIDDSKLRLQWAPAPDLPMSYHNAEEYARHLSLAGGEWRLPTRAELKSLYDESKPGSVDPKFNVSKNWVWTSDVDGPSGRAVALSFRSSNDSLYYPYISYARVLTVRSRQ